MSELRKDPIVGRWVVIAANRADRPGAFITSRPPPQNGVCPFCAGSEALTPGELFACRDPGTQPDGPGWRVRVVPNKFPALQSLVVPALAGSAEAGAGRQPAKAGTTNATGTRSLYQSRPAIGAHEVVIESPRHLISTSDLSDSEAAEVFLAYRERLADLRRDPRMVQPIVFKNVGEAAGSSIQHTHSQLMVLPLVPTTVAEELVAANEFHRTHRRCIFCEILEQEVASGERTVLDTDGFVCFCPYASRYPYETWVLPKAHASHFDKCGGAELSELARVMRRVITKIEALLDRPAYNYLVHTAPFDTSDLEHYHWHIEIAPVLARTAGFELGSGYFINPIPPERAAETLRDESRESRGSVRYSGQGK
jgi:UDPglucose--hexose-1-phosphate uridylyltransferase